MCAIGREDTSRLPGNFKENSRYIYHNNWAEIWDTLFENLENGGEGHLYYQRPDNNWIYDPNKGFGYNDSNGDFQPFSDAA